MDDERIPTSTTGDLLIEHGESYESEIEYLQAQLKTARTAITSARTDLKRDLSRAINLLDWTVSRPITAVGLSAAGGFALAYQMRRNGPSPIQRLCAATNKAAARLRRSLLSYVRADVHANRDRALTVVASVLFLLLDAMLRSRLFGMFSRRRA